MPVKQARMYAAGTWAVRQTNHIIRPPLTPQAPGRMRSCTRTGCTSKEPIHNTAHHRQRCMLLDTPMRRCKPASQATPSCPPTATKEQGGDRAHFVKPTAHPCMQQVIVHASAHLPSATQGSGGRGAAGSGGAHATGLHRQPRSSTSCAGKRTESDREAPSNAA